MAIGYLEKRIVSVGRGESLVGLQRYICRQDGDDPVTGRRYYFAKDSADLHSYDVLLPPCAPYEFHDPTRLCAAAERRETTIDRKTGLPRFKKNAQVGIHIVLALPRELSPQENRRLACAWARSQYVNHGVGAIVAVHYPDDPATGNFHAHIILTTRVIKPVGLGPKARHLNPRFSRGEGQTWSHLHAEDLPGQWARFQDDWFRKNRIELQVDPFQASPGVHHAGARTKAGEDAKAADLAAKEEARRLLRDPAQILVELTRRRAMFARRDIATLLRRHGFPKDEIAQLTKLVFAHPDLVRLYDPETAEPLKLFTTRQVREQEALILDAASVLQLCKPDARRQRKIAAAAEQKIDAMGLAPEQAQALRYLIDGPNLRILRGIAGAGKSYTIRAVRESLDAGGFRVIGLAPTNTVACTMAVDGFAEAATVDLELIRQESDCQRSAPWDHQTCIIIDEAAMLDANRYQRILVRAAAAGARVILVGDEKQLASVERGGVFEVLKQRYGCTELLDVRRQTADWAKAASQDFAAGRIRDGIKAYEAHGCLRWSDDLDAARATLVARWGEDVRRDPDGSRFVYAATNAMVNQLNRDLQNERWRGQHVGFQTFETCRGTIDLVVGDRIQLHGNDRKLGLFNGLVGTVRSVAEDRITFVPDGGRELSFDPRTFQDWALGYCGTTYRGQGKTQAHVYALYDHKLAWHARTSYVGFTRHKDSMSLFVPRSLAADTDTLVRQMDRADQTQASILFLDDQQAGKLRKNLERERAPSKPTDVPVTPVASEIKVARRREPGATAGPRPIEIIMSGTPGTYDLNERTDRNALVQDVHAGSDDDLVAAYRRVSDSARANPRNAELKDLSTLLASTAKRRGIQAGDGNPHPDCLADLRRPDDPLHTDTTLAPEPGEPDIRPMLQQLESFETERVKAVRRLVRGFEPKTLEALRNSLWCARARAGLDERLRYPVVIAIGLLQSWAYRWRERLGSSEFPPDPPGLYRKHSLSLFAKARSVVRIAELELRDEPQATLTMSLPAQLQDAAPPQRTADVSEQSRRRSRAELLQRLEQRLASTIRRRDAAIGDARTHLTMEIAAITMEIESVDRGLSLTRDSSAKSPTTESAHGSKRPEPARPRGRSMDTADAAYETRPSEPRPRNQSTTAPKPHASHGRAFDER
jgi:Ti-type conjugative transfer relaxase TraA